MELENAWSPVQEVPDFWIPKPSFSSGLIALSVVFTIYALAGLFGRQWHIWKQYSAWLVRVKCDFAEVFLFYTKNKTWYEFLAIGDLKSAKATVRDATASRISTSRLGEQLAWRYIHLHHIYKSCMVEFTHHVWFAKVSEGGRDNHWTLFWHGHLWAGAAPRSLVFQG